MWGRVRVGSWGVELMRARTRQRTASWRPGAVWRRSPRWRPTLRTGTSWRTRRRAGTRHERSRGRTGGQRTVRLPQGRIARQLLQYDVTEKCFIFSEDGRTGLCRTRPGSPPLTRACAVACLLRADRCTPALRAVRKCFGVRCPPVTIRTVPSLRALARALSVAVLAQVKPVSTGRFSWHVRIDRCSHRFGQRMQVRAHVCPCDRATTAAHVRCRSASLPTTLTFPCGPSTQAPTMGTTYCSTTCPQGTSANAKRPRPRCVPSPSRSRSCSAAQPPPPLTP